MSNVTIKDYEKNYDELLKSIKIVENEKSSLEEIVLAIESGINAHNNLEIILKNAENKINKIVKSEV